jgi:ATP-binding cassette subfamily C protein CydD
MKETASRHPSGAKAWLAEQSAIGKRAARPLVVIGLISVMLAAGQAWCAALLLAGLLGDVDAAMLWPALGFAALALARAGLAIVAEARSFDIGAGQRSRLRRNAMQRLLVAGPALLRGAHSAELAAIVVDRVETVDGFFARWLPAAAIAVGGPLLLVLVMLPLDPLAALVLLVAGALVPVAMALSGIGAGRAAASQFEAMTRLQTRFLDRMRGIATIVLNGRVDDESQNLLAAASELRHRTMRILRVAFLSSVALDCAAAAALVTLAIRAGQMVATGTLAHPAIALFGLLLVPEFFAPLRQFSGAYQDQYQAKSAADLLSGLPPLPLPEPARPVRTVEAHGITVAFEAVGLVWDAARGPALSGVTFRVAAGETLVLAGPSGSGKSSVIELLLGFVRPTEGRVTFNGADIGALVPAAHARLVAWIGQKPVLFAGSIRDNIRFARPDATEAEILAAAKLGRVDGFAAELPQGLDTLIGEGGFGLSGGQAQRVAIARAALKNAPLLLLDEPTAHLDPVTEAEVLDSLRRLALGRTVILATHSAAAHAWNRALGGRRVDLRAGSVSSSRGAA